MMAITTSSSISVKPERRFITFSRKKWRSTHEIRQAPSRPASLENPLNAVLHHFIVRRGDNLTVIARWFHVRGYAPLYDWNKTVIGRNPDLIYPGQKIIVVPGGAVSVGGTH